MSNKPPAQIAYEVSTPKLRAYVSLSIYADCPKCKKNIEMTETDYLNDEAQLWKIVGSNDWENLDMQFECPHCKAELILDELEH